MRGMPDCREVVETLASDEREGRGVWRRLSIRLHLLRCRDCRRYLEQLRALARGARDAFGAGATERAALERLRARILADDSEPGES